MQTLTLLSIQCTLLRYHVTTHVNTPRHGCENLKGTEKEEELEEEEDTKSVVIAGSRRALVQRTMHSMMTAYDLVAN